jgi:hypothetical protein
MGLGADKYGACLVREKWREPFGFLDGRFLTVGLFSIDGS